MKYAIKHTNLFKKAYKRCLKRGLDVLLLQKVIDILADKGALPNEYKPHKLVGDYAGCWECHISPDWLLVWQQDDGCLVLLLVDTGTHSDIFG